MQVSNFTQPVIVSNTDYQQSTANLNTGDSTQQTSSPAAAVNDTLTLTQSDISVARQIVSQQIDISLQISSPANAVLQSADSHEHHVGNLINKVLQKIGDEHESSDSHDNDDHHEAVKSVQLQVNSGFQQSRIILSEKGIMNSAVSEDVSQTQLQVNQAIDQVAGNSVSNSGDTLNTSLTTESASLKAAQANRELNTSLEVTTRDGDVVTINLSKSESQTAGSYQDSSGSLIYAGSSSSSQLNISIQGDLSEKESHSIKEVVEKVSELVNKLFNGNIGDAMQQLSELDINTRQLSGIALNMTSNQSVEAISAYSQVSQMSSTASSVATPAVNLSAATNPSLPATPSTGTSSASSPAAVSVPDSTNNVAEQTPVAAQTGKPASLVVVDVAAETGTLVSDVISSNSFENPFSEVLKLFDSVTDLFPFETKSTQDNTRDFVKELFHEMVNQLESSSENEDGEVETDLDS